MTVQISAAEFEEKVLNASGTVFVDFFAVWCGPCRVMAPVIEEVAAEVAGKAQVYKLDIDTAPMLAMRYAIDSVPTFIVFKDGKPVVKAIGVQPKENILALFN